MQASRLWKCGSTEFQKHPESSKGPLSQRDRWVAMLIATAHSGNNSDPSPRSECEEKATSVACRHEHRRRSARARRHRPQCASAQVREQVLRHHRQCASGQVEVRCCRRRNASCRPHAMKAPTLLQGCVRRRSRWAAHDEKSGSRQHSRQHCPRRPAEALAVPFGRAGGDRKRPDAS